MPFIDRTQAGKLLGDRLAGLPLVDPVVLTLPRGGVPVGNQVALAIGAPLDVIVVRKLGVPFQPELAMGAIGEDGVLVMDEGMVAAARVDRREIDSVVARERAELDRRVHRYRSMCPRVPLPGRTAVVVDDGIATGSTARAACLVARAHGATRVVVATPVASHQATSALRAVADQVIALEQPEPFYAVGQWYLDFNQTSDDDVLNTLAEAQHLRGRGVVAEHVDAVDPPGSGATTDPADLPLVDRDLDVGSTELPLKGHLTVPSHAKGLVAFVHGSGSSRHSPRNRFVARALNEVGLATLLFDLLTPDEEPLRSNVFDIALLGGRLVGVTGWLARQPEAAGLGIGYFGASTGSAAALWAAARCRSDVRAIVSRGGRPDLATSSLAGVTAPTLLVVGERDEQVLEVNRRARTALTCENRLVVVPRATHLFEEPGTLRTAADLAAGWFTSHLPGSA